MDSIESSAGPSLPFCPIRPLRRCCCCNATSARCCFQSSSHLFHDVTVEVFLFFDQSFSQKKGKASGTVEATVVTLSAKQAAGRLAGSLRPPPRRGKSKHVSHPDCLSSSINLCLLTQQHDVTINPRSPLTWSRREPSPHSRDFLSCCIVGHVHFIFKDHLDFFKLLTSTLSFFQLFFIFPSLLPPPSSSSSSPPVVVLCHRSSGCKRLHCVCILVMRALVTIPHLFAEVRTELDVANLLIKPQIRRTDRGAACSDQCISV